jgi:hypothetical protein
MSRAPAPTPALETAEAQTGSSISTAIANAYMTNMNEITPNGTLTYEQTGDQTITGPNGQTYTVPQTTVTQTLSDAQQAIQDQNNTSGLNLATLGSNLSGQLGEQLTGNFELGNEAVESRLFDLGSQRLDPMFAQREEDLRSRLANQGIRAGTEAYDREMANFSQGQNDAYNQLLLDGRGQASQELLTEDNQRINQISALMSGGQVSQPNFATSPNIDGIQGTDVASIISNTDNANLASWGQSQAATGSALGALGGLFALSDERAKENIVQIGKTDAGLGIYSYRYKGSPRTEIGLLAQEVQKLRPDAVALRPDGFLAVNYEEALA